MLARCTKLLSLQKRREWSKKLTTQSSNTAVSAHSQRKWIEQKEANATSVECVQLSLLKGLHFTLLALAKLTAYSASHSWAYIQHDKFCCYVIHFCGFLVLFGELLLALLTQPFSCIKWLEKLVWILFYTGGSHSYGILPPVRDQLPSPAYMLGLVFRITSGILLLSAPWYWQPSRCPLHLRGSQHYLLPPSWWQLSSSNHSHPQVYLSSFLLSQ